MKLELSEALLTEFVTAVSKTFSKPKQVCIVGDGHRVMFYTAHDAQRVAFSVEAATKEFSVAVEASKFMSAAKQLYSEYATLDFKLKYMTLTYGDAHVKLPFQTPSILWAQQMYSEFDVPPGFLQGLTHTAFVPDKDARFTGVLIDPLTDGSLIARFDGSVLAFTKIDTVFSSRFVVFKDFAKLAKTKTEFKHILVSNTGFGLCSAQGVQITSTYLVDSCPHGYLSSLGLSETGTLANPKGFDLCYEFDARELKDAVKLVAAVVGDDEHSLKFKCVGREKVTDALVWSISAKSYKGLKAEENVRAVGNLNAQPKVFKLHKKTLVNALDNYVDKMYLVDNENAILLVDAGGNSVVVLMKLV